MGNTTAPASATFLQAVQKCGLLEPELVKRIGELVLTQEPRDVAKSLVSAKHLTPWQARQLLKGFHALKMGNYTLRDLQSKTDSLCTFLAEHGKLERKVCLTMLSAGSEQSERVTAFLQDARSAASLDHRNLAHVYDVDQDGERLFVVTECIEGSTLADLVADSPLSDVEAGGLIRQVATGLEHAHQQGVVHGDLRPHHFVVDPDGILKVLGLGFTSLSLETENPFAPTDGRNTPAGDMYSLGNVLHFALTGKPASESPVSEQISPELQKVCKALLQPKGRPDASRLVAYLTKWLDKQVTSAAPADTATPAAAPNVTVETSSQPEAESQVAVVPVIPVVAEQQPGGAAVSSDAASVVENSESDTVVSRAADTAPIQVVPSSGDAAPADGGSGAFAITAAPDPRRGGSKAKSKPKGKAKGKTKGRASSNGAGSANPTVAHAAGQDDAPASAPAKKGISTGVLIGGGVGGVVLLAGLIFGLMYVLGDKDKDQTAQTDPVTQTETDAGDAKAVGESNPAEQNPAEQNPTETNPPAGEANPDAESNPNNGKGNSEQTTPAPPKTEPPAEPPVTEPEPSEPPKKAPAKKTPPKKTPPKKTPPKKPKIPPKTPPKKKAPPANPFAKFPKVVELPAVGQSKVLGELFLEEKQLCFVKLRGGESTLPKSKAEFKVKSGTDTRAWSIIMSSPEASTEIVARITHSDNKMSFEWTDAATAAAETVVGLKNAMLSFNIAGSESHLCALRTPAKAEPMMLKLEGASSHRWQLDGLPDASRLSLKIASVEGLPEFVLDPEGTMLVNKGEAMIKVGKATEDHILQIGLTTAMRGNFLEIKATPYMFLPKQPKKRLNPKGLAKLVKEGQITSQRANAYFALLSNQKKQAGNRRDPGLDQRLSLAQQGAEQIKALLQQVQALETLGKTAENGLPLHIKVTASAGVSEIVVLDTKN